jgi:dTDP-4-dehydrorhamnose reductase
LKVAKVLITGASGLLGSNLAVVAAGEHPTLGIYHQHPLQIPGVEMVGAELADPGQASRVIAEYSPDWVVHCAAASEVDRCELDPAWAWRLNREMAKSVSEAARLAGARLAHISTDAVFDGEAGDYRESDDPRPIMIYGESKLAGEQAVAQSHPEALILRTNLFGWGPGPKRSLAEWFLERLEAGDSCPGFTDVYFSPLLAQQLARAILDLLASNASGLFHLPGRTCLSKYEFGVQLAKEFGLDPARVRPMRVGEAKLTAARPRRLCLNGEKVEGLLGRPLPELESGLRELRESRGTLPNRRQAKAGAAA